MSSNSLKAQHLEALKVFRDNVVEGNVKDFGFFASRDIDDWCNLVHKEEATEVCSPCAEKALHHVLRPILIAPLPPHFFAWPKMTNLEPRQTRSDCISQLNDFVELAKGDGIIDFGWFGSKTPHDWVYGVHIESEAIPLFCSMKLGECLMEALGVPGFDALLTLVD